ncbi:MAG: aspartate aminotransferase [Dehalococcoidia bacterium]|nr:aspartate aminotransferase [Dehalococcoidia bacterium]MQG16131.1 pyridoxal phosphate-dependent aminotransferase [SAR202 cluster bacterium]
MSISIKLKKSMEKGSWIRKMFEEGILLKAKVGADKVYDLSLGNPIFEPPPKFMELLRSYVENPGVGLHRYMPNAGLSETRSAVAESLTNETGLTFSKEDIVMTCGAGGALNIIIKTLINPGDEIIVFAPYFAEYFFYADNHGGKCVVVEHDDKFMPKLSMLESLVTEKTKMVIINSPNNPSGVVYPTAVLTKLGQIIKKLETKYGRDIFIVSDEPYRKIIYKDDPYSHIYSAHSNTIVATSHSKDLGLAGERIGYVAVNPYHENKGEIIDGLTFSNRVLGFVNAPALIQHLVTNLQNETVNVEKYKQNRDFLWTQLTDIGYEVIKPEGAFYMFPKCPIQDDVQYVNKLRENNVLVVPGSGFGSPGYFRISYCVDENTLQGCIDGFRKVFLDHT